MVGVFGWFLWVAVHSVPSVFCRDKSRRVVPCGRAFSAFWAAFASCTLAPRQKSMWRSIARGSSSKTMRLSLDSDVFSLSARPRAFPNTRRAYRVPCALRPSLFVLSAFLTSSTGTRPACEQAGSRGSVVYHALFSPLSLAVPFAPTKIRT